MLRREQQRRLDVEQSAQAQARLYAMISHDIRTPLNGIMGSLELIKQDLIPQAERRHLQTISACSDTMLGLFNDILDFHKFEHQAMPIMLKVVTLQKLIDESVSWTAARSDLDSPQFELSLHESLPDLLRIDPLRTRQLLINLLSNAARYGGGHPVSLTVWMEGGYLKLSIRDRGPGMAEDEIAKLFQPFVQGGSGKSKQSGAGLGLAIVKTIVDAIARYLLDGETAQSKPSLTSLTSSLKRRRVLVLPSWRMTPSRVMRRKQPRCTLPSRTWRPAMVPVRRFAHHELLLEGGEDFGLADDLFDFVWVEQAFHGAFDVVDQFVDDGVRS